MSERLNFTRSALSDLPLPDAGKRAYYSDTKIDGLQLVITSKGTKSFYLYKKISGRPTRYKLGRFPAISTQQARKLALKALGEIADGKNPQELRRAQRATGVTLETCFEEYLKRRTALRPKTVKDYKQVMSCAFGDWQKKPVASITKDLVSNRHRKLGRESGEAYANLSMRILRAVLNFAAANYEKYDGSSLLPENPVSRLSQTKTWYPSRRRRTIIKADELPAWFGAVLSLKHNADSEMAPVVADYLLLLLFTGLRSGEAATLTRDQADLKSKVLTIHDTKNREVHTLPLPDFIVTLLKERLKQIDGQYLFPGRKNRGHLHDPRKQIAKVIEQSGVVFTPHDLRRTFATVAEGRDIPAYALKRLLNHKLNSDVTAGYIAVDVERLRKPMQTICDYLLKAGKVKAGAKVLKYSSAGGSA